MAHRAITHHPLKHSPCIPYPQSIRWNHNVWIGYHSHCNMQSMWSPDIKQKIIGIGIDYWMVEWMCVYVQTVWHYWLSHYIQKVLSMNIDERHPLFHTGGHVCRRSLAYWWVCYRASWTCNCFHCCWRCTTLIQFTLVDFVHRVWHTHPSARAFIDEQIRQLGRVFIIHDLLTTLT